MKQEETPEETYERVYREALLNNTKPLKLWEICEIYHKERKDKEIAELKEKVNQKQSYINSVEEELKYTSQRMRNEIFELKESLKWHKLEIEQNLTPEISALKEEVERLKNLKEPYIDRDRRTWEDCEYDSNGNHSPDCETCREK